MSFGFSIGDFLAVGKLVADIIGSLRDAGGAREEYQELIRELEALDRALKHVDRLSGPTADNIKCAALMCRYPLEEFSKRIIMPYENALGVKHATGIAEATKKKLQWTFGKRGEVAKLRNYLGIHIGIINMELLTTGLGGLGSSAGSMICQVDVQREMEQSRVSMSNLDSRLQSQSCLVRAMESSIASVLNIIRNDVLGSLKELLQAATNIFSSTQQALFILLEIRSTLNGIQTQHTFFQAPVRVEDALGRVWPIPSEYSTADLHALIRSKFIGSPGQVDVEAGNYEVYSQQNPRHTILAEANVNLIPGTSVTMAVVLQSVESGKRTCPVMMCGSPQSSETVSGGRKCDDCGVHYHQTSKIRKRTLEEVEAVTDRVKEVAKVEGEPPTKRPRIDAIPRAFDDGETQTACFKHILVPQKPAREYLRDWMDHAGTPTSTKAEYIGLTRNGEVCLHKENGAKVKVATSKLSFPDLNHIRHRAEKDYSRILDEIDALSATPLTEPIRRRKSGKGYAIDANYLARRHGKVYLQMKNGVRASVLFQEILSDSEDVD